MRGKPRIKDTTKRARRARASWKIRRLSKRQRAVLHALFKRWDRRDDEFVRPESIGGSDKSHHPKTLIGLVKRGLVSTKKIHTSRCHADAGAECTCRGRRRYRISMRGVRAAL